MEISEIFEKFRQLVQSGSLDFELVEAYKLPGFAQDIIRVFLEPYGIQWKIATTKVGKSMCLKLADDWLQYIDIDPVFEKFLWCIGEHEETVHPDEAGIYLLHKKFPALEVINLRVR